MTEFAKTPQAPYYAVIFTSELKEITEEYNQTAQLMEELAKQQEGFLGIESARNNIGITVSYWTSLDAIKKWKMHSEHIIAQQKGKNLWYKSYKTRICLVEREYSFDKSH